MARRCQGKFAVQISNEIDAVAQVKQAWKDSRKICGYHKIHDDLIETGEAVSENRVARLIRIAGIQVRIRDKKKPGCYGGKPSVVMDNTPGCRLEHAFPARGRTRGAGASDGDLAAQAEAGPADPFRSGHAIYQPGEGCASAGTRACSFNGPARQLP